MPAPGCRASSRVAMSAVMADGGTTAPFASTRKHRSASPSKASPASAPCSTTARCRSTRFAGTSGFASWLGNVPSSSKNSGTTVIGVPANTAGAVMPGHAVAGVGDHGERADGGQVDERAQVGRVVVEDVASLDASGRVGQWRPGQRDRILVEQATGERGDFGKTGLQPHRGGRTTGELDAAVVGRVVAGREDRARQVEVPGREVDLIGGGQAQVDHVGATRDRSVDERGAQHRRVRPHVPSDDERAGLRERHQRGEGGAERVRDGGVELVGDEAPDVVGLDDRRQGRASGGHERPP